MPSFTGIGDVDVFVSLFDKDMGSFRDGLSPLPCSASSSRNCLVRLAEAPFNALGFAEYAPTSSYNGDQLARSCR
ncbi:hypothetical protein EJ110_NYTH36762 [Nymphaea thermarum]|nr:hypothetical protein EJ110_NYTH36762 [Nymphaea thermarum]